MTTKAEILEWYIVNHNCKFPKSSIDLMTELSSMIDSLVKSCPSEYTSKYPNPIYSEVYGYNKHCEEVEEWKKEVWG